MKTRHKQLVYIALMILGVVFPYAQLIPYMIEQQGFPVLEFTNTIYATRESAFIAADLGVTGLAFIVFAIIESRRIAIKYWWLSLLAIPTVGISLAFPLFLYLRERAVASDKIQ